MQQTTLAAGGGLGIRQGPRGVWNGDVWQAEPNMATAMRSVGPQHSKHYTNWTVRRPSAAARLLLVHVRNSVQYVSVFHIPRLQELTVLYLTTLSIFKIILFKFSFSLSGNTVRCALIGWLRRRKEAPYRACVRACVCVVACFFTSTSQCSCFQQWWWSCRHGNKEHHNPVNEPSAVQSASAIQTTVHGASADWYQPASRRAVTTAGQALQEELHRAHITTYTKYTDSSSTNIHTLRENWFGEIMWTVCNIELTWTVPEHRDLVQHSNQNEPSDSKTNKWLLAPWSR